MILSVGTKMKRKIKAEMFCLAIRQKKSAEECLLLNEKLASEFLIVKNPLFSWCADPFLIDFNNSTWLFAEIFNLFTGRGSLYASKVIGNKIGRWTKCNVDRCHLSFPNVFWQNGKIYMIPETSELNKLSLYECISFPKKWKKIITIISDHPFVDTIRRANGGFISYEIVKGERKLLFLSENGTLIKEITDRDKKLRPAGKLLFYNKQVLFPSQDCSKEYGQAIVLNVIDGYSIEQSSIINPSIFNEFLNKQRFVGMHTYNANNAYEVVDLKFRKFSFLRFLGKPLRFLFRRKKQ